MSAHDVLDQLDTAREQAHDEVIRLCSGGRFTMRVPVDEARDSDTVLVAALDGHRQLSTALRGVLAIATELDADTIGYGQGTRRTTAATIRATITRALTAAPMSPAAPVSSR